MRSRLADIAYLQLRANVKTSLRYRADFIVGNIGTMVQAVAGVAAYLLLFSALGGVGGFTASQWTMVLGIVTTARGLWNTLFVGTLDVSTLIRTGRFDSFVVRPVSSLFLVSTGRMSPDLWGETAVGVFLTVYGIRASGAGFTVGLLAQVVTAIVIGATIYYAMYLLVQVASFWLVDNSMLLVLWERLDEYTRVPQSMFPAWLRTMFSSVLPLAFIGYLPGRVILGQANPWMLAVAAAVATGFVVLATLLWGLGLRRYSSAG